jgi:hypothetical protein
MEARRTALPSLSSDFGQKTAQVRETRIRRFSTTLELNLVSFFGEWIGCFEKGKCPSIA